MTTELVNKERVRESLNLSMGKIDKMMKLNQIPYYKIGKSVRFNMEEVFNKLKSDYER